MDNIGVIIKIEGNEAIVMTDDLLFQKGSDKRWNASGAKNTCAQ